MTQEERRKKTSKRHRCIALNCKRVEYRSIDHRQRERESENENETRKKQAEKKESPKVVRIPVERDRTR